MESGSGPTRATFSILASDRWVEADMGHLPPDFDQSFSILASDRWVEVRYMFTDNTITMRLSVSSPRIVGLKHEA